MPRLMNHSWPGTNFSLPPEPLMVFDNTIHSGVDNYFATIVHQVFSRHFGVANAPGETVFPNAVRSTSAVEKNGGIPARGGHGECVCEGYAGYVHHFRAPFSH